MQGLALAMKDAEPVVAKARAERRRFRRVRVDLPGRLFTPAGRARGALLGGGPFAGRGGRSAPRSFPSPAPRVVLYVDGFGRFEGHVARRDGYGFGVAFACTPAKRERIAEQLTLFLNKALVDDSVLRRHERSSQKGFAKFTRADGQVVNCEVMDISVAAYRSRPRSSRRSGNSSSSPRSRAGSRAITNRAWASSSSARNAMAARRPSTSIWCARTRQILDLAAREHQLRHAQFARAFDRGEKIAGAREARFMRPPPTLQALAVPWR